MDESAYTRMVLMFIKLTNASDTHRDNPIYLNPDNITCIFQDAKTPGGSLTTFVHSRIGESITWEVEESPSEIMKLIEAQNAKREGCSCK
jgi:hypothetical protein